jgi:hypothetical protein
MGVFIDAQTGFSGIFRRFVDGLAEADTLRRLAVAGDDF